MKLSALIFACLCWSAHALQLPGPQGGGGLNTPSSASVASMPWVRWFKADAITPVGDGTAISSWLDSGGSGDPAVQATGGNQPIYKIGGNGINGVPTVRFSGGQWMRTAAGGAALGGATTPWYMAAVFKLSDVTQYGHPICWGDDGGTGTRRAILNNVAAGVIQFNGKGSDVIPNGEGTISNGTVYFAEVSFDGTFLYFSLNGTLKIVSEPNGALGLLTSSSGAPITLGANNGASENLFGDVAEIFLLGSSITRDQQTSLRAYIAAKYGMSMNAPKSLITSQGKSSLVGELSGMTFDGPTHFGTYDAIKTSTNQNNQFDTPATHSFRGMFAADSSGMTGDHSFQANSAGNVGSVWQKNVAGFSAWRYFNAAGSETGTMGIANSSSPGPFKQTAIGNLFIEAYGDGTFSFIQTASALNSGGSTVRYQVNHAGNVIWYDGSAAVGTVTRTEFPNGVVQYTGLSTTTINALTAAEGMTVYDNTLHVWKFYNGTVWKTITTN